MNDRGGHHLSPQQIDSLASSFQRDLAERAQRLGLESEAVNEATANVEYLKAVRTAVDNITRGQTPNNITRRQTPNVRIQAVSRAGGLGQDLYRELFAAAYDGQYPDID